MRTQKRAQLATVLSIAGVVAAGTAAYAVNSTVLSAPEPAPIQVSTTAPAITQAATSGGRATAADAGVATPATGNESTPAAQSISSTTTTYQVGKAGSVVVDTSTGKIVVTSIVPASGWTSEPARIQSDGSVKVHFVSSTSRLEFVAKMIAGKVSVSVLIDDLVGIAPNPAAPRYENHDDDEHEREEHESGDDD